MAETYKIQIIIEKTDSPEMKIVLEDIPAASAEDPKYPLATAIGAYLEAIETKGL